MIYDLLSSLGSPESASFQGGRGVGGRGEGVGVWVRGWGGGGVCWLLFCMHTT